MDKKKIVKIVPQEELQGFEEFIDSQSKDSTFLPRPAGAKKENSFEHFEFLTTDSQRLVKVKNLFSRKLPFITKYNQAQILIKQQKAEISFIKNNLFMVSDKQDSLYRKSLRDVFDGYFEPPKNNDPN
jgi:hypothetical protein